MCVVLFTCYHGLCDHILLSGTTGSSLSPLGLAAASAPGMIPINDDDADLVTVIGKGMY